MCRGKSLLQARPEVIATFPDYGLNYKYGGVGTSPGRRYRIRKAVRSRIAAVVMPAKEEEPIRATGARDEPGRQEPKLFASGLRNAV